MRILRAALIAISLVGAASCAPPPPPPVLVHADTTAGLRVRIKELNPEGIEAEGSNAAHTKAMASAQHALIARLQEAGYVVVEKGAYDIGATTSYSIKTEHRDDPYFTAARLRLIDRKDKVLEDIKLQFNGNAAPAAEPDRVAVSLVNEMNKSPKLGALAQSRAKSAPAPAPAAEDPAAP